MDKNNTLVIIDTPKIEVSKVAVPIVVGPELKVYNNADTNKLQILTENKGKAGIYLWTHLESNKTYIGSAVDLSKQFFKYYLPSELKRMNNYISRALICHTHSAFSLSILEYIDISGSNKDKKQARELILCREQYYIDSLLPEYNILSTAGNSLGYKHSEKSLAKMSLAKLGFKHSEETLAKMKAANSGENHPLYGKNHSAETKAAISAARGTAIYVYSLDKSILVNSFASASKAAKHFEVHHNTISRYAKNGSIFKDKWILSTSLITKEE